MGVDNWINHDDCQAEINRALTRILGMLTDRMDKLEVRIDALSKLPIDRGEGVQAERR